MKLLIEDDAGNQSVVPVNHDEITIGRKEGNKIRLTERNVSREHARLVRDSGAYYIEDVKARYGIELNGEKVEDRAPFSKGDVVQIGDYRLTLRPETSQAAQKAEQTDSEAADEVADELQKATSGAPSSVPAPGGQPQEPASSPEPATSSSRPTPSAESPEAGADTSTESTQIIETEPAELVVISSNFAGQRFPLDNDEMVIGRAEACDIIIDHRSVSAKHAKILREGPTSYKIVDLDSSNGMVVDGEEYETTDLRRGDVIELGHVKLRFVEPGENYTFSPQQAEAAKPAGGASDDDSTMMVLAAGALLAAVAIGVGVFWSMGVSDSTTSDESKTVVAGSNGDDSQQESASSDESSGGEADDGTPSNVSEAIKMADKNIKAGRLDQALGVLETAKGMMNPTPEQQKQIDEKMSQARVERPHQSSFQQANDAIDDSDFETALESLRAIPDQSVFHAIASDKGLYGKVYDGLLKQANSALSNDNHERAGTLASKVKSQAETSDRKKRAQKVLDAIDEAKSDKEDRQKVAVQTQQADETSGGRPADRQPEQQSESTEQTTDESAGAGQQAEPSDEQPEATGGAESGGGGSAGGGTISTSQAKSLFQSATKKWIRGDHSGAISDCQKALQAGYKPCYRVLGMVHKKRGNKSKACSNFEQYLGSNPSDAAGIRKQMSELGCP